MIIFQAGLIKLCNKEQGNSNSDLERRIKDLEEKLKNGVAISVNSQNQNSARYNVQSSVPASNGNSTAKTNTEAKPVSSAKQGPITQEWPNILNDFKNNGKTASRSVFLSPVNWPWYVPGTNHHNQS